MTAPNIGDLLRAWRGVSFRELESALSVQRDRPNERLGTILVQMGVIDRDDLRVVLDRQAALRAGGDPTTAETIQLADLAAERLERP